MRGSISTVPREKRVASREESGSMYIAPSCTVTGKCSAIIKKHKLFTKDDASEWRVVITSMKTFLLAWNLLTIWLFRILTYMFLVLKVPLSRYDRGAFNKQTTKIKQTKLKLQDYPIAHLRSLQFLGDKGTLALSTAIHGTCSFKSVVGPIFCWLAFHYGETPRELDE